MNFMSNPSSSSSSSFHCRSTTNAPPQTHHLHHHHTSGTLLSEDAGEDNEDLTMMPLFSRSEATNTNATPVALIEKEHMFDKVVTPSDVGKLNRLVIPKQHAEKYFPLDSSTNEKGLFLNFEDRNGKPWRFRYSYWNSSQSYVMTKGWSRFVKEKKLDAGDIVSFQRGLGDLGKDRLFIDWRRRPDAPDHPHHHHQLQTSYPLHHHQFPYHRSLNPWSSTGNNPMFYQPQHHHHYGNTSTSLYGFNNSAIVNGNPCPPGSILYLRSGAGNEYGFNYGPQQYPGMVHQLQRSGGNNGGGNGSNNEQQVVFDSVPVVQGKAAAKRLRLFGVNMDCPVPESDECNRVLSHTANLINHTMPMLRNFGGGFDSPSSSSVPSLQLRPHSEDDDDDDGEEDDDKGKGASMSLDLDI